jgi:ABC-type transporter Mla MlaB component
MERLRQAMVSSPTPWYLAWGALVTVDADAVVLLDALFSSLCDEAVPLRFDGAERLVRAVRSLTPSGDRGAPRSAWQLRLNALRAMGLQDDFELAALDYCVTYEVAPPAWVEARCTIEVMPTSSLAGEEGSAGSNAQPGLALQGQILGDASMTLSALNAAAPIPGQTMAISCRDLIRVDFAAAGSILNWVAMRQAEGNPVQFQDVHRLVAAFFNVIGINEHAKVLVRPM